MAKPRFHVIFWRHLKNCSLSGLRFHVIFWYHLKDSGLSWLRFDVIFSKLFLSVLVMKKSSTYSDTLRLLCSWRENLHFYFPEQFSVEITQPFNAENHLFLQNKILIVGFKPNFPISSIKVTPLGYLTVIKTFLQSKLKK